MTTPETRDRQTGHSLKRFSETNRPTAERIAQWLRAKGRKPGTVLMYVYNLERADRLLGGTAFEDATLDDWTRVLAEFRQDHAVSTTH